VSKSRKKRKAITPDRSRKAAAGKDSAGVEYPFIDDEGQKDDKIFIECPGATVYDPQTREIIAGVEFLDENEPDAGYRIIDHPVYAPEHKSKRLIKREHRHLIRRCQACQDLTVRLIRREGPDFFIPSPKHPRKKQLKSIARNW